MNDTNYSSVAPSLSLAGKYWKIVAKSFTTTSITPIEQQHPRKATPESPSEVPNANALLSFGERGHPSPNFCLLDDGRTGEVDEMTG